MNRTLVGIVAFVTMIGTGCSSGSSDAAKEATTTTKPPTTTAAPAPPPLDDQTPPGSINGLTVDGDTIWVASISDDEILQVDRETGAILARFDTNGAGPDDVAVAPDGSVWSTGFANGDVGRIADGTYEVVTTMEAGINPIDIADDGTVFIGTFGPDGTLSALETDGGAPTNGATPKVVADPVPDINGFWVDEDGTIISPAGGVGGPGSVISIDSGGEITTVVDGLPGVAALDADPDGVPFALANATGEVIRIDLEAGTSEVVRTVKQGVPFDNLSFADDGTLYLSSFVAPTITEVASDGTERLITIGG